MRQLTIRNLDDDVYERLRARAKVNQRSLEAEIRTILSGAVLPDRSDAIRKADGFRESLVGRYSGDATAEIRKDRDR